MHMRAAWLGGTLEEMRSWFGFSQVWLVIFALAAVLVLTGAFDTSEIDNLFLRSTVFAVSIGVNAIACVLTAGLIHGFTGRSAFQNFSLTAKIGISLIPLGGMTGRFMHAMVLGHEIQATLMLRSTVHAAFLTLAVLVFMYVVRFRKLPGTVPEEQTAADTARPIEIPNYMESEDHYLKIVCDNNVELVRANLGEMATKFRSGGFRCHKSYWVAHHAIVERKREGRQVLLVLKDGTEIPVGRSYEKLVREILSAHETDSVADAEVALRAAL